jgi:DNA-binding beta-propeller fold protein YncE
MKPLRRVRIKAVLLLVAAAGIILTLQTFHGSEPRRPVASPSQPPRRLAITGTLRLPSAFGVVEADGSIWIASYGSVLRVDPKLMTVTATIPVRRLDEGSIAAGADLWATVGSRHAVVEIDPETARILRTIRVPGYAQQVAADGQDVWVLSATTGNALAFHIDGATGSITSRSRLTQSPNLGLVAAAGDLWVSETKDLVRIDAHGAQTFVAEVGTSGPASSLAYGAGSIWSGDDHGILRIDPSDGRVIARLPMRAWRLAYADGRLWALTPTGSLSHAIYLPDPDHPSTVLSIDPRSNRIDGWVSVGFAPSWLAAGSGSAWVASFDPARLQRIAPTD